MQMRAHTSTYAGNGNGDGPMHVNMKIESHLKDIFLYAHSHFGQTFAAFLRIYLLPFVRKQKLTHNHLRTLA